MTIKEAKALLAPLRMTLKKDDAGDYVVNFVGAPEATAYYASDLEDAVSTAREMAKWRGRSFGRCR